MDLERFERAHPDYVAWWREAHGHVYGPEHWKTLLTQQWPMWTSPPGYAPEELQRVAAPTLVLLGDRDQVAPVEDAVDLYRRLPDAELAVVPQADHFFPWGRTALFTAVVLDFLRRHAEAG